MLWASGEVVSSSRHANNPPPETPTPKPQILDLVTHTKKTTHILPYKGNVGIICFFFSFGVLKQSVETRGETR